MFVPAGGGFVEGATFGGGAHQNTDPSCNFGEENSPDHTYDVTFEASGTVTVLVDPNNTNFNTVIYALNDCLDPETNIACDGSDPGVGGDVIDLDVGANETIELVLDGQNGDQGNYRITFSYN